MVGAGSHDNTINSVCESYKTAFLLWDGAFAFARKVNPTGNDIDEFEKFVLAAVDAHKDVGCHVTHKVHLMIHHVGWQMAEIEDGLGDYLKD